MTRKPKRRPPAPDQTKLALERTVLAHERTLMAWVRTATSLITFGFTLYKFFFYLQEQEPAKHAEQLIGPRTYGLIMIGIGVFTLAAATWQHRRQMKRLRCTGGRSPLFAVSGAGRPDRGPWDSRLHHGGFRE